MTADPFLWAHSLSTHIFDIATGLRPTSVRDQVTRARLLMRRAYECGLVGAGKRVLISGAGIAGATCAVEAATRYDAEVLLLEQEHRPFLLQHRCLTRSVDPNLYDWPAARWEASTYPSEPDDLVTFRIHESERPRNVAQRWGNELAAAAASNPKLHVKYNAEIRSVSVQVNAAKRHEVEYEHVGQHREEFDVVIFAEGPGEERDSISSHDGSTAFWGYRFWDTDPFMREALAAKRILIAGSGDGALQDFRRLLLRPRVSLRQVLTECAIPEKHRSMIEGARHHNLATFIWCASPEHEHENDAFMHRKHLTVVDELFAVRSTRRPILKAVRRALRSTLPAVTIAHACGHFTHGYPLNRFVTILLLRAVRELGYAGIEAQPHSFVTAIDCRHNVKACPKGRERDRRLRKHCYASAHRVYFGDGRCFDRPPQYQVGNRFDDFDAIILRLGMKEHVPTDFPRNREEKPLRHLLPTHLAHLKR